LQTSGAWRREIAELRPVVIPRENGGPSTPRLLGSIAAVSGILGRPHSRAMTSEGIRCLKICINALSVAPAFAETTD